MYTFDSRVRYSETASDGRLGICSAVHYMQDCSIFQSEALGVGVGELKKHNRAWLISSWQVEFLRRPELGEHITIGTWASGFKAMYGYRNFLIQDDKQNPLVKAATIWIYLDLENGRPAKAEGAGVTVYPLEPALTMEPQSRKIRIPEGLELKEKFLVRCYQIDTNGHVNNGAYIQMAQPWLPPEEEIKKLRVEYKRAAVMGDVIAPSAGAENGIWTVELGSPEGTPFAVVQAAVSETQRKAE